MSNVGEFFGKYIGVLGVITVLLVVGYILAPFVNVLLPNGYTEITLLVVGSYAGKNGTNVISRVRGQPV